MVGCRRLRRHQIITVGPFNHKSSVALEFDTPPAEGRCNISIITALQAILRRCTSTDPKSTPTKFSIFHIVTDVFFWSTGIQPASWLLSRLSIIVTNNPIRDEGFQEIQTSQVTEVLVLAAHAKAKKNKNGLRRDLGSETYCPSSRATVRRFNAQLQIPVKFLVVPVGSVPGSPSGMPTVVSTVYMYYWCHYSQATLPKTQLTNRKGERLDLLLQLRVRTPVRSSMINMCTTVG